ncbi:MAG: hypothetical protein HS126_22085 [Anaerolineales bacterium]|nr:hypothetical protein [Anaerolineales bacterium]
MTINKNRTAAWLAVMGRRLARWRPLGAPLRPLILWLWKKTIHNFLED